MRMCENFEEIFEKLLQLENECKSKFSELNCKRQAISEANKDIGHIQQSIEDIDKDNSNLVCVIYYSIINQSEFRINFLNFTGKKLAQLEFEQIGLGAKETSIQTSLAKESNDILFKIFSELSFSILAI